jgi:hypothetical protein
LYALEHRIAGVTKAIGRYDMILDEFTAGAMLTKYADINLFYRIFLTGQTHPLKTKSFDMACNLNISL